MYPPWSTTFDAHIHRGRIMHVMVKDRTVELKSEATVALDLLATRCKKENGKLEIWVSAKASLCVCHPAAAVWPTPLWVRRPKRPELCRFIGRNIISCAGQKIHQQGILFIGGELHFECVWNWRIRHSCLWCQTKKSVPTVPANTKRLTRPVSLFNHRHPLHDSTSFSFLWVFSWILVPSVFFSLFVTQLELKPQGRLLMEATYYLEKSGEWLKVRLRFIKYLLQYSLTHSVLHTVFLYPQGLKCCVFHY